MNIQTFPCSLFADFKVLSEIKNLGREMVGQYRGLPLAIIVLGGRLVTGKSIRSVSSKLS